MKYRVICIDTSSSTPDGASWITSFFTNKEADNFARRISAKLTYTGNGVEFYLYNRDSIVVYLNGNPL